ncbi:MAG TPA: Crp/Fnr family transcriptional regulator [Vicinamibacterales bacterium]|nr:Crp/Fnr family transcriptional regulator [Vicinamibacterales bacterium]
MARENRLLASLQPDERLRLASRLEHVVLPKGKVLYEAGDAVRHAYFPTHGLLSLLAITPNAEAIEVAMVGSEGFIGLPIVLHSDTTSYRVVAQLSTAALRMRAEALRAELGRSSSFHKSLLRYAHDVLSETSRSLVCHRFHSPSQRLSRWLLGAGDRLGSDTLDLTHEGLAHVLGIPRTAVTEAAVALQDAGHIWYRHGHIIIKNRPQLRMAACDCYRVNEREEDHVPSAG